MLLPVVILSWIQFAGALTSPEGLAWLEENKKKDGVVVLPSGLQYKVSLFVYDISSLVSKYLDLDTQVWQRCRKFTSSKLSMRMSL
jgi:hypothetical protein